jgi:hypothetical protein
MPGHPGIVQGLDAGLEGTTAYLASEYVAAETLDVALRHLAPAPLDRALPILTQIADAIDAAWAVGLGHGALHPRDVFVTVDQHSVRLTGFGVVPAMERIGVKAPVRRPYTAPERVNGEAWDIRADVYSLGAIAHELLTGRRPAGSGEQDGSLTTGTSPEQRIQIRRVLSASLAEHPQHRFQSARAFVDALAAVASGDAAAIPDPEDEGHEEHEDEHGEEHEDTPAAAVVTAVAPLLAVAEASAPEPEPAPAPAPEPVVLRAFPNLREPLPAEAASVGGLNLREPERDFSHDALHTPQPALEAASGRAGAPFSWPVALSIAAAGIAIGIVIGYGIGRRSVEPSPAAFNASSSQTDVPVASEPASPEPPPAAPEPATRVAEPPPVAPEVVRGAAESGRLAVRSVPAGALVTIDGRARGQTPVTVTNLALGAHTLEIARPGYVPHRQDVALTVREPARTVSVQLQAGLPMAGAAGRATVGSIFIDSRPQAARVIIDGRFVGMTPLRVSEMSVGTHAVRLERAGYFSFTTSVGVTAGEQARVTAALEER